MNNRLFHKTQDYCATHFHHRTITILVHSKEVVEQAVSQGYSLFTEVYRLGTVLFKANGLPDEKPKLQVVFKLSWAVKIIHADIQVQKSDLKQFKS